MEPLLDFSFSISPYKEVKLKMEKTVTKEDVFKQFFTPGKNTFISFEKVKEVFGEDEAKKIWNELKERIESSVKKNNVLLGSVLLAECGSDFTITDENGKKHNFNSFIGGIGEFINKKVEEGFEVIMMHSTYIRYEGEKIERANHAFTTSEDIAEVFDIIVLE